MDRSWRKTNKLTLNYEENIYQVLNPILNPVLGLRGMRAFLIRHNFRRRRRKSDISHLVVPLL